MTWPNFLSHVSVSCSPINLNSVFQYKTVLIFTHYYTKMSKYCEISFDKKVPHVL